MFQEWVEEFEKNKLKEEMSEADKMFEELGYEKFEGLRTIDFYNDDGLIQFDKACKHIHINKNEETDFITLKELQAINKKVEELKWMN